MARVRAATNLPCTVGFGIRTPQQAAAVAALADGVVVGSAIVSLVAAHQAQGKEAVIAKVLELTRVLAGSTHAVRRDKVPA
jgi:tryptophan synthase alpha chain